MPGHDEYGMDFWWFTQDLVKEEVMGFLRKFFEKGIYVKEFNSTYLGLVPKKGDANNLKDLRSISLSGSPHMLLPKLLADSLRKLMSSIIRLTFICGREKDLPRYSYS